MTREEAGHGRYVVLTEDHYNFSGSVIAKKGLVPGEHRYPNNPEKAWATRRARDLMNHDQIIQSIQVRYKAIESLQ